MLGIYKNQYKQIIKLATPVILSQVGTFAVQIFDNAMVGYLGTLPLAAVSFGGTVFFIMFLFLTGLSMAITPLVGEAHAQGKIHTISCYLPNSLLLFTIIGILATLFQFAIIPLLYYLGQPLEVVEASLPYYKYLVWSIIPYMVFCTFKQFWEGLGNTTINMVIIISANVINIFLNWLLIFGNWGFPRMEAAGAGHATLVSRICMVVFAYTWFVIAPQYRLYLKSFNKQSISWAYHRALLKLGLPMSIQTMTEGAATTITAIMVGWFGTTAIAAHQITMTVSSLAFMFAMGLGSATTICISHEYGLKEQSRLKKTATASLQLMIGWIIIAASALTLFREPIISIFNKEPEVITIASQLLLFCIAYQLFDGLQMVTVGQLRGIQDVKRLMPVSFLSYIVIHLPIGYFLSFVLGMGVSGLWLSFTIGLMTSFILLRTRFRKQLRLLDKTWSPSDPVETTGKGES